MRRRSVDQNTACLHSLGMLHDLLMLIYIYIKGGCVAVAAVSNQLSCFCKRFVEILCLIHGKNRRQLLMCKFFIYINGINLAD